MFSFQWKTSRQVFPNLVSSSFLYSVVLIINTINKSCKGRYVSVTARSDLELISNLANSYGQDNTNCQTCIFFSL